jgi:tryptophanyl-tRNA synthetase
MSKSYDNHIELFGNAKQAKKRIMGIKTDSTPVEDPKDPDKCNVMTLLKLLASPEEVADWQQRYRAGGMGYGEAKKRLHELFVETFAEARERYDQLKNNPDEVEAVLSDGGRRARAVAQQTMADVRKAVGLVTAG